MSKMLVIGVGNIFRGDDSVGLVVARRVREAAPPDVVVLEQSGEGAALMEAWREAEFVILVD
ncbi:MAG TPA: hydrogenase maturation protease, partial [Anaerolineae bacterium]|nr:hydrogenase maturation protease [Anaerolineae bacterium]